MRLVICNPSDRIQSCFDHGSAYGLLWKVSGIHLVNSLKNSFFFLFCKNSGAKCCWIAFVFAVRINGPSTVFSRIRKPFTIAKFNGRINSSNSFVIAELDAVCHVFLEFCSAELFYMFEFCDDALSSRKLLKNLLVFFPDLLIIQVNTLFLKFICESIPVIGDRVFADYSASFVRGISYIAQC